jgi:site-specific recombinase XerD
MATPSSSKPSRSPQIVGAKKKSSQLPKFSEAAEAWLESRRQYLHPNTIRTYRVDLKALIPFIGEIRVDQIEIEHIRSYQRTRGQKAIPQSVNRELGVFQQVMKEHDQWARLAIRYRTLRVTPRRAGHSLTPEEEQRLYDVAFTRKKWLVAAHSMVIMMNTTMGFGELRKLRRYDVDMERCCVTVREGAKNSFRHRTIPLNSKAKESMEFILARWQKLGGCDPEHYILPHRPRGERAPNWRKTIPWILTEPTGAMTSAFRSFRKAAGLPHFRIYDCRVQAITKLLSNPAVSLQVSKEIAGHISEAMQSRYSIQLFNTKKAALDALDGPRPNSPESPNPPRLEPEPIAVHGTVIALPRKAVR